MPSVYTSQANIASYHIHVNEICTLQICKTYIRCVCRLTGAALIVPIINYWWPSFPAELSRQAFKKLVVPEQRTLWIAHNIPSFLYLWMTQRWLPSSAAAMHHPE